LPESDLPLDTGTGTGFASSLDTDPQLPLDPGHINNMEDLPSFQISFLNNTIFSHKNVVAKAIAKAALSSSLLD
jgi:hypothetical protein